MAHLTSNKILPISDVNIWFDNFIAEIKTDQLQLETDTAGEAKKDIYTAFIKNDSEKILAWQKDLYRMSCLPNLLIEYIKELKNKLGERISEIDLAVDLSDNKILSWVVVPFDDENYFASVLFMAEAKTNSNYYEKGFCISTTIVYKEDNLPIPEQYKLLSK